MRTSLPSLRNLGECWGESLRLFLIPVLWSPGSASFLALVTISSSHSQYWPACLTLRSSLIPSLFPFDSLVGLPVCLLCSSCSLFSYAKPNMKFVQGEIEHLVEAGIALNSIDVAISNCVINLVPHKRAVLSSVFSVLKEGGEFHFADIYMGKIPTLEFIKTLESLNTSCISKSLHSAVSAGLTTSDRLSLSFYLLLACLVGWLVVFWLGSPIDWCPAFFFSCPVHWLIDFLFQALLRTFSISFVRRARLASVMCALQAGSAMMWATRRSRRLWETCPSIPSRWDSSRCPLPATQFWKTQRKIMVRWVSSMAHSSLSCFFSSILWPYLLFHPMFIVCFYSLFCCFFSGCDLFGWHSGQSVQLWAWCAALLPHKQSKQPTQSDCQLPACRCADLHCDFHLFSSCLTCSLLWSAFTSPPFLLVFLFFFSLSLSMGTLQLCFLAPGFVPSSAHKAIALVTSVKPVLHSGALSTSPPRFPARPWAAAARVAACRNGSPASPAPFKLKGQPLHAAQAEDAEEEAREAAVHKEEAEEVAVVRHSWILLFWLLLLPPLHRVPSLLLVGARVQLALLVLAATITRTACLPLLLLLPVVVVRALVLLLLLLAVRQAPATHKQNNMTHETINSFIQDNHDLSQWLLPFSFSCASLSLTSTSDSVPLDFLHHCRWLWIASLYKSRMTQHRFFFWFAWWIHWSGEWDRKEGCKKGKKKAKTWRQKQRDDDADDDDEEEEEQEEDNEYDHDAYQGDHGEKDEEEGAEDGDVRRWEEDKKCTA